MMMMNIHSNQQYYNTGDDDDDDEEVSPNALYVYALQLLEVGILVAWSTCDDG